MANVTGADKVQAIIRKAREKAGSGPPPEVVVGYTQNYGIYVHENLQAAHRPPTQAKFLEQPARELGANGTFTRIIQAAMAKGATLEQALLLAGLRLQRESQKLCPVDTGALRGSAFTRLKER